MRMTVDGTNDQFIKLQGVEGYSFCDADGGAAGEASESDEGLDSSEDEEGDIGIPTDSSDEEGEEDEEDDEVFDGDEEESEDDTAELVSSVIGDATAPEGYKIIEEPPPMETESDLNDMIGSALRLGNGKAAACRLVPGHHSLAAAEVFDHRSQASAWCQLCDQLQQVHHEEC